jgi:2-oxo-4-hydroxy-4-carboxy-5-ureidoimidazoline decarboxylase
MSTKPTVKELLSRPKDDLISFLGTIYEHSPWVAERLEQDLSSISPESGACKIETVSELAAAMKAIVSNSSTEHKLTLLRAHPDLCEKVDKLKALTKESQTEQGRAGLQSMTDDETARFTKFNTMYREKFNFPFILAVRNATKYTVLAALEGRVKNPYEREFATAMEQVHKIAWMRLLAALDHKDAKGFLTCHVLDTANGCAGKGEAIGFCVLASANFFLRSLFRSKFVLSQISIFVSKQDENSTSSSFTPRSGGVSW